MLSIALSILPMINVNAMSAPSGYNANLESAHRHSSNHRAEILASKICGCFYCRQTFRPSEIERWLNEGDGTALCPHCGIDSVIGDQSGFSLTPEFLLQMHDYWFT